jgi:polar amino acid transport system substrate-binding protein
MKTRIGLLGLVAAVTLTWGGRAAGADMAMATPLRVGVAPNLKPLIFKEGREFRGLEADLARALASRLGRPVTFVEARWEKLIDDLEAKKFDIIMSGMTVTPARQTRVAFAQPYLLTGQTALVRRDQAARMQIFFRDPANRFGAQRNTTGAYYLEQTFPQAKRTLYGDPAAGADAVVRNKIDAFITDASINWYLASVYESKGLVMLNLRLTQESLAWAVRKEDTSLFESVNDFAQKAIASGELKTVVERWLPKFLPE